MNLPTIPRNAVRAIIAIGLVCAFIVQTVVLGRPANEGLLTLLGGIVLWYFPKEEPKP